MVEKDNPVGRLLDDLGFDLVSDLERQSADAIRKLRAHERLEIKLKVFVQPGNSSDIQRFRAKGVTCDVSEGGARLLLPLPLTPGDVYRVGFDSEEIDLPIVFARCMRCRFVREGAFESGLLFFNRINLGTLDGSARSD